MAYVIKDTKFAKRKEERRRKHLKQKMSKIWFEKLDKLNKEPPKKKPKKVKK